MIVDVRLTMELTDLNAAGDQLHIIDLLSAGCSVAAPIQASWWTVTPGSSTPVDQHAEHEVWIVSTGAGAFTCGSETSRVSAGDLLRIPPRYPHHISNDGDELLTVYSLWWD